MLLIFLSTPTYPILLVPCQMSSQDVSARRGERRRPAWMQEGRITQGAVIETRSPHRFDQQDADEIGIVS